MSPKSTTVILLLLIATIKTVLCIDCYTCFSLDNPDCLNPEKSRMKKVKCDTDRLKMTKDYATRMNPAYARIFDVHIQEHAVPLNCLKHVVTVSSKEVVLRGCQLPKDNTLDVCTKVLELEPQNIVKLQHCSLCSSDGCNGSTTISLSFLNPLILLTAIAYSLQRY